MKMKKTLVSALLCAVFCAGLCVAMTACENNADDTSSQPSAVSASDRENNTLTELEIKVQEEEFQQQVQALSESYEEKGIKLEVTAEGDSIVYKCMFTVDLNDTKSKEELAEHLESKEFKTSIDSVLRSFKAQVPQTRSVIVRYIDVNGNVIASKEYK